MRGDDRAGVVALQQRHEWLLSIMGNRLTRRALIKIVRFFHRSALRAPLSTSTCRRVVLHDWTDADVVRILRNLHKSMAGTTARLVLVEQVVAVPQDHITVHYIMDLHMHVAFGGKERTRVEWRDLLKQGGFEMREVKDTRSIFSVIEAVPV